MYFRWPKSRSCRWRLSSSRYLSAASAIDYSHKYSAQLHRDLLGEFTCNSETWKTLQSGRSPVVKSDPSHSRLPGTDLDPLHRDDTPLVSENNWASSRERELRERILPAIVILDVSEFRRKIRARRGTIAKWPCNAIANFPSSFSMNL